MKNSIGENSNGKNSSKIFKQGKTYTLALFSIFMVFVTLGSLGETLIAGVNGLELAVSIYKKITSVILKIVWWPLSLIHISPPPREAMDLVILINIAFRYLIWPIENVAKKYKIMVIILASLSTFMIFISSMWIGINSNFFSVLFLLLSAVTLIGSLFVLASQRLFSDGLRIVFRKTKISSRTVHKKPNKKLLMTNLFLWPYVILAYESTTRKAMIARMSFSFIVIIIVIIVGLSIRALDDYADITLPLIERWGNALDQYLSNL